MAGQRRPVCSTAMAPWRNRIVGAGTNPPDQLVANPRNWRTHPTAQRAALTGALAEVGWVARVLVNRTTGHVVDGHAGARRGAQAPGDRTVGATPGATERVDRELAGRQLRLEIRSGCLHVDQIRGGFNELHSAHRREHLADIGVRESDRVEHPR